MKTTLKTALTVTINAIKRFGLWFQIRSLEITVDGQDKALQMVRCRTTLLRIEIARQQTRRELSKARAAYLATLPAKRRTWRLA